MAIHAPSGFVSLEASKVSNLIPRFVRKVAAKLMKLTGRPVCTEWVPTSEQEAAPGWDSHTNDSHPDSEWGLSMEQEKTPDWDCHAATLPGETDTSNLEKRDSGYNSFVDSTEAIIYSQLPFKTKHYLLNYTQQILESTCLKYAREHFRTSFEDPVWKKINMQSTREFPLGELVDRDWLAEDGMELVCWMQMFSRLSMPRSTRIFESVMDLRNASVHRGDRGQLGFEEYSLARELPKLFGDSKGESDITNAFRYILDDPTLDEDTKASIEQAMYIPRKCTTHYQLLDRIQTLLEETCFNYAARKIPDVLARNGWNMPEQVEFQNWANIFYRAGISHDDSAIDAFPDTDPRALSDYLFGARLHIRNTLGHRLPISDEKLTSQIHRAINICILLGDWDQAVEIEVLAEGYFTKTSRQQVLKRLRYVYTHGSIDTPYERQRRVAIARLMARTEGEEPGEEGTLVSSASYDVEVLDEGYERTFSPSMHEALKRVEVLE